MNATARSSPARYWTLAQNPEVLHVETSQMKLKKPRAKNTGYRSVVNTFKIVLLDAAHEWRVEWLHPHS